MGAAINRRKFFTNITLSSAGIIEGRNLVSFTPADFNPSGPYDIMKEVMKYRKINAHEHVYPNTDTSLLIDAADRLGMEKIVVSRPVTTGSVREEGPPDVFRKNNDLVLSAMKQFPDRILGLLTLNPVYQKESLEEINRCLDLGMIGLKVYNQVKINDPLFYPVIERLTDHKMIILVHASASIGFGGQRTKYGNIQPNASVPEDFIEVAERYPEAMLQYAHTGGGGDWEYACKAIKNYPNIYVDTSGSNNEGNMVDFALKYLGEDRLFFGTDGSYYQGVGSIISSQLNERQRKKIFFGNFNDILRKSGNNVN